MKLIGLHGLPRSGKDTVAKMLHGLYGFERRAFADPLKQAAAALLNRPLYQCHGESGFDREAVMPEWGFSMRWFLQMLGTECMRDQIHQDFWLKRMEASLDPWGAFVITDVRFQNEADFIHSRGGWILEIRRSGISGSAHSSDRPLQADRVLHNDGSLEDLKHKILTLNVLEI